jgi:Zn-dependent M28 family amino/carboxypeptidase
VKDEIILVDAHFDHVGIGRPVDGDSIYNGADDDASGVVTVLEVARQLLAGKAPRRTVVFAAMTGEEQGLLGTGWYIEHPPFPLERHVGNLEVEMIGRPDSLAGGFGKGWLTGYERSTMGAALAAAGIPLVADPRPDQRFFERSDNIAFARRGIVAHTLSSFNLHTDYHRPSDEASKVDAEHMAAVINAATKAVRVLADGPTPAWVPGGKP